MFWQSNLLSLCTLTKMDSNQMQLFLQSSVCAQQSPWFQRKYKLRRPKFLDKFTFRVEVCVAFYLETMARQHSTSTEQHAKLPAYYLILGHLFIAFGA